VAWSNPLILRRHAQTITKYSGGFLPWGHCSASGFAWLFFYAFVCVIHHKTHWNWYNLGSFRHRLVMTGVALFKFRFLNPHCCSSLVRSGGGSCFHIYFCSVSVNSALIWASQVWSGSGFLKLLSAPSWWLVSLLIVAATFGGGGRLGGYGSNFEFDLSLTLLGWESFKLELDFESIVIWLVNNSLLPKQIVISKGL